MNPEKEPGQNQNRQIQLCPGCDSRFVQLVDWEQDQGTNGQGQAWRLWQRCPDCGWRGEGTFQGSEVDEYDRVFDEELEELRDEADELGQEIMTEFANSFSLALDLDLIGPDDFR